MKTTPNANEYLSINATILRGFIPSFLVPSSPFFIHLFQTKPANKDVHAHEGFSIQQVLGFLLAKYIVVATNKTVVANRK
jgi:hypothetical protein